MKRSSRPQSNFSSLTLAFALAATTVSPLLTSCGAQSNDATSTDTGNPPVVDARKIDVTSTSDGVLVRGTEGAIQPGGAEVVVKNVTSGGSASVTAAADGSFEAELSGRVNDQYEVEASAGGRSAEASLSSNTEETPPLELQCLDSADDAPDSATSGPQSCNVLWAEARCLADEAVEGADRACASDDDCVSVNTAPDCNDSCGGLMPLSTASAQAVEDSLSDINSSLCAQFEAEGCSYIPSGCPGLPPSHTACVDSTCQQVFGCDEGSLAADALVEAEMETLSEGCTADDECFVVFAPTCSWDCTQRPMYVSQANASDLNGLHSATARACLAALDDEICPSSNCTSNDPSEQAVCRSGRCVDSRQAADDPDQPLAADETQAVSSQSCVWGIDELLAEVGAPVTADRVDCGSTNGAFIDGVVELYECFDDAPADPGAEFTLNNCTDCSIPSTYVSTPDGNFYHILMEADLFGDQWREAKVERCSSVELASGGINCTSSEELYSCTDPIEQ